MMAAAALCGALLAAGMWVLGDRRHHLGPQSSPGLSTGMWMTWGTWWRVAVGLGAAMAAWWGTGTPVVAGAAGVLALVLPWLLSAPPQREAALCAALESWLRGLVAVLPVGVSLPEALAQSTQWAPATVRPALEAAVARMEDGCAVEEALRRMADEIGSPEADAALAAVALVAARGGTGASATLTDVAESCRERAERWRDIGLERARPRLVVRQVSVIMVVFLGLGFVLGGDFLAPYATPLGQLVLGTLLAGFVGSLAAMRHLTTERRRPRLWGAG